MPELTSDHDLLREFAEHRSETAFRALVGRHADLVFATALRRVNEAGAAQEVTQDVFVALARKAPWLREEASLAGWLYKTTLLLARQWWRGEMRRRGREQTALELNTTMKEDGSLLQSLAGVLDEGLLELREADRQALLLRFFERRSHREVGAALGIAEDAARKRVDKALAQLTGFFQKRGYAIGSVAPAAGVLNAAALTAPTGLAATAAQAAIAQSTAGALSWVTAWLPRLLRPSKAQTALLCTTLLLVPGAWQGARWMSANQEQKRLAALLDALQVQREGVAQEQVQVQRQIRKASNSMAQLKVLSGYTALLTEASLDPHLFRWDESAEYVRAPKLLLRWLTFDTADEERTFNSYGARVSPTLLGVLCLTAQEQARVQQFSQSEMDACQAAAESRSYFTNLPPQPPWFKPTQDTRAWVTPPAPAEEVDIWSHRFGQGLSSLMGADRAEMVLRNAADDGSLSMCFNKFGSEDFIVAVTPRPEGGCNVERQTHFQDGKPAWRGSGYVPLSLAMNLPGSKPPMPARPEMVPPVALWGTLQGRPLPAPLVEYLRQWTAAHPEVPDQKPD